MSEISDLFAKDPLSLTKEDRTALIAKYRTSREQYMLGAKPTRDAKPKAATGPKPAKGSVTLEDLDL